MQLMRTAIRAFFRPRTVYAHCDIPCGIYETNTAMIAAHTVVRMVGLLEALPKGNFEPKDHNNFVRYVKTKEQYAQLCKDQLTMLWSDFFTQEHLQKFPDLHDKIWKAAKLCSSCKRDINIGDAQELVAAVKGISQIFDQLKNEPKEDLTGSISDISRLPHQGANKT